MLKITVQPKAQKTNYTWIASESCQQHILHLLQLPLENVHIQKPTGIESSDSGASKKSLISTISEQKTETFLSIICNCDNLASVGRLHTNFCIDSTFKTFHFHIQKRSSYFHRTQKNNLLLFSKVCHSCSSVHILQFGVILIRV